jgi:hypothetical protein
MSTDTPQTSEVSRALEALSTSELDGVAYGDDALLAVVRADSSGLKARLYACEVLLRRDEEKFLKVVGAQVAAGLYASALQERTTPDLNSWAFLGMGDLGPLGLHLVACGDPAVAALAPLLDDTRSAGIYSGSKESKLGNSDRTRVCDFAAFFISKIRHLTYQFQRDDTAQRDAEIERLKNSLPERH